jgi:hypothetical protein
MMQPGSWGGGASGFKDDRTVKAPHEDLAKRGGNLTLEEMKEVLKKTTPKQRTDAGITDQQWKAFAKAVHEYEQALAKQMSAQAGSKDGNLSGDVSQLPSISPAQVQPTSKRTVDPLQYNRALPPPEFREAQRIFTGSAQDKQK